MTLTYDELQSDRYNWNSFPGNLHGILLDRAQPAVTLCSYKFLLAQAMSFTMLADGKPCEITDAKIIWQPHKVQGVYSGPDGELTLEAMFAREELVAIRYTVRSHQPDRKLAVRVSGVVRNGEDKDHYFHFQGEMRVEHGMPLVQQAIGIPDYHMHQVGPIRHSIHYLSWLASTPAEVSISTDEVVTHNPIYLDRTNVSGSWRMERLITLSPAGEAADTLYLAVRWLGVTPPHRRDIHELQDDIQTARRQGFAALEQARREYYTDLLQKLPAVKPSCRPNREYMVLYAQAWICIWQNISGDLVTSRKTVPAPSAFVSKVADNGFGPAQWETSLAGHLVSFINPELGLNIIESVLACVEEDGFLPEDLIFNRDVKLSSLEPYMIDEIYRRTGRIDFLERNYDRMHRQLLFHIKHPGFQYLTQGGTHLAIQNFYSLLALDRIARVLGRHASHLKELQLWRDEMIEFLDRAYEKEAATGAVFEFLHHYTDAAATESLLTRLREHHMVPPDRYFMYRNPDGVAQPAGREDLDAYKMVHFFHFILGLEKYGQDELLATLTANTYRGLRKAGDFWECYYVTGEPWGNGPMSIFGAFGWIWLLLDKPPHSPVIA